MSTSGLHLTFRWYPQKRFNTLGLMHPLLFTGSSITQVEHMDDRLPYLADITTRIYSYPLYSYPLQTKPTFTLCHVYVNTTRFKFKLFVTVLEVYST